MDLSVLTVAGYLLFLVVAACFSIYTLRSKKAGADKQEAEVASQARSLEAAISEARRRYPGLPEECLSSVGRAIEQGRSPEAAIDEYLQTLIKLNKPPHVYSPLWRHNREHWAAMRHEKEQVSAPSREAPRSSRNRSESLSASLRYQVLQRDRMCQACGAQPRTGNDVQLHVDHIVPRSKGGQDHIDNLQVLCDTCNLGKGNRDDTDFR